MSDRYIRCPHCGLPHDAHLRVCPTTGLRIESHERVRQRRRSSVSRDRAREHERMVGRIIDGKYRLVAAIGEGGMSSIYEAEHQAFERRVAIKVLHPSLCDDPEAVARLQQEAKVVSTIGHRNICEVFDLGRTEEGSPYLVMELLTGESLAERLKADGPMPFYELAPLMGQILRALSAAHEKGILHRDLKPENVFIQRSRRTGRSVAKLLDFGISKSMSYDFIDDQRLTHSGMVMGTPYYMAPEQARGDSGLDQRVDLWAVGVVMYEALTGRRPFVATNYNALLVKILTSRPRPLAKLVPGLPNEVVTVVDRALSKLREDRFQSAGEFITALDRAARSVAVEDPAAPTMTFRRAPRKKASAAKPGGVDWSQAIEDPSTFVDDEMSVDPAELPRGTGESGRRAEAAPSFDGYVDEQLGATVQDAAIVEAHEQLEGDDRSSRHDTERTEVIHDRRLIAPGASEIDAPDTEQTEVAAPHRDQPAAPQKDPPARRDRDTAPSKRKRSRRPPPVSRPRRPADDEQTKLYDIDAARKKLRERQEARRRSEGGGNGPDDGTAV